jgi:hypothetical protein
MSFVQLSLTVYLHLEKRGRLFENSPSAAQWPYNEVPYILDPTFSRSDRAVIASVSTVITKYLLECCGQRYIEITPLFIVANS